MATSLPSVTDRLPFKSDAALLNAVVERIYRIVRIWLIKACPWLQNDEDALINALHEGLMSLHRWHGMMDISPLGYACKRSRWAALDAIRQERGRDTPRPIQQTNQEYPVEPPSRHEPKSLELDLKKFMETLSESESIVMKGKWNGDTHAQATARVGVTEARCTQMQTKWRKLWKKFDTEFTLLEDRGDYLFRLKGSKYD